MSSEFLPSSHQVNLMLTVGFKRQTRMHRAPVSLSAVYMSIVTFSTVFIGRLRPQVAHTACSYMHYWISPLHHQLAMQGRQCTTQHFSKQILLNMQQIYVRVEWICGPGCSMCTEKGHVIKQIGRLANCLRSDFSSIQLNSIQIHRFQNALLPDL